MTPIRLDSGPYVPDYEHEEISPTFWGELRREMRTLPTAMKLGLKAMLVGFFLGAAFVAYALVSLLEAPLPV